VVATRADKALSILPPARPWRTSFASDPHVSFRRGFSRIAAVRVAGVRSQCSRQPRNPPSTAPSARRRYSVDERGAAGRTGSRGGRRSDEVEEGQARIVLVQAQDAAELVLVQEGLVHSVGRGRGPCGPGEAQPFVEDVDVNRQQSLPAPRSATRDARRSVGGEDRSSNPLRRTGRASARARPVRIARSANGWTGGRLQRPQPRPPYLERGSGVCLRPGWSRAQRQAQERRPAQ
jgi:hypothetical protein